MKKNKKIGFEELKIAIFENNQANKRNKDRLFKLAKASDDIETIERLRDEFGFKGARIYLDKLANSSVDDVIQNRDIKLLKKLIDRGVDLSKVNIAELIKKNYYPEFIEILIDNGADIYSKNEDGETSLTTSIFMNKNNFVEKIIINDINLDIENEKGVTALSIASYLGNIEVVKLLLKHGANVNKFDKNGSTSLAHLISKRMSAKDDIDFLIAKELMENNSDVNKKNIYGQTLLIITSRMGDIDFVKLLILYHAKINEQDMNGMTALMSASIEGHFEIVKLLLQNNADVHLQTKKDKSTALELSFGKSEEVFLLLKEYGAIPNRELQLHNTPTLSEVIKSEQQKIPKDKDKSVEEIFEQVNSKITSPFIAERFILEELDAASRSDDKSILEWVENSGYKEYQYKDAMDKSLPEVDSGDSPQQILMMWCLELNKNVSNMALTKTKIVEKIMKYHSLGKYSHKFIRITLDNFEKIDNFEEYILYQNMKYEKIDGIKYFNLDKQTYIELNGTTVIFSYVDYEKERKKDFFEIIESKELYEFEVKEKEHNPKGLLRILNLFTKENPIKYTSHSFEWGKYNSYQNFIDEVKKEFSKIDNALNLLSSNLHSKISSFLFNDSLGEGKSWGKNKISIGWSSSTLKEWCEVEEKKSNAKKAIYFPLPKDFQCEIDGKILTTFDDICNVFKDEIEIRDNDKLNSIFEKIEEEVLDFDFEVEYSNLENITFYTDVEYFENAVTKIFEQFKERAEHDSILVEADNQESYVDIIIEQKASTVNKSSEEMKKEIADGDFEDIKKYFFSLCDWSIEAEFLDGNFRVEYLSENQAVKVVELEEKPQGFRHILRFYK